MITPTEILTKRTCERFKIGVDERQRMCHNKSIYRQNMWCFFEKIKIMLVLSLLRKHDNASMLRDRQASARRMASQIVTLSGLTRLKSAPRIKYDLLSLIHCMTVHVVDTVSQLNFPPPKGSWSERHTCNMAQLDVGSKAL